MKSFTSTLILTAAAATGVMSAVIGKSGAMVTDNNSGATYNVVGSVINSAAYSTFDNTPVVYPTTLDLVTRDDQPEPEPNPNRPEETPDYVYVLQCTESGFRGDCLVFGSPPGTCVSYFNFQSGNSTNISDKFNDKVNSLSTNTGGMCQFYKFKGCNNKGDDRGLSSSYNYDLENALPEDPRTPEYANEITSWRC
ncbi:hypothetical protein LZ32DRAFT_621524 [Colletotrichum eremochloae]|nr:hypothetical protein LZ32DRAFT_621524 [Colletotrichum eremochloae]